MANAIDKAVEILKLLVPEGTVREWGASEIARRSGHHVGTVHRILFDLKRHGLVMQNEDTKKFKLGLVLVELGFIARENLSILETAKSVLQDLAGKAGETAHLTIREGCDGVLIDKIETASQLKVVEPIGMRTPLTRGALKKCILAFLPEEEIIYIIDEIEKRYRTAYSHLPHSAILDELREIRERGYAISIGEVTPGTVAIASPVFDLHRKVVAAVGIDGPENRFSPEELPQKIDHVRKAGLSLTKSIGGNLP